MDKVTSIEKATAGIKDSMTLMVGGFLGVGTPHNLVDAVLAKGVKNLTLIANDTAMPSVGIGKLVVEHRLKKVMVSHIGTNPETGRQMMAKEMEVDLIPQGTLAERIRAAGAGLGGILTPTGVGTVIEEGKQKMMINGKDYLLELPISADVALLKAKKADKAGNLVFHRSARNFNPMMALAAELVIVEAEQIVEIGGIDPDDVMVPGVLVNWVVQGDGGAEHAQ